MAIPPGPGFMSCFCRIVSEHGFLYGKTLSEAQRDRLDTGIGFRYVLLIIAAIKNLMRMHDDSSLRGWDIDRSHMGDEVF